MYTIQHYSVFSFLFCFISAAHCTPQVAHTAACTTGVAAVAWCIHLCKATNTLRAEQQQLERHLFLQSNESIEQTTNLIFQHTDITEQLDKLKHKKQLSFLLLAVHLVYLGYHLRDRILQ